MSSTRPPPPKPASSIRSPTAAAVVSENSHNVKPSVVAQSELAKTPVAPPKAPEEALKPAPKPPAQVFRQPTSSALAPDVPAAAAVRSFLPPPPKSASAVTPPKSASAVTPPPKPASSASTPASTSTPPKPSSAATPPKPASTASTPPPPKPAATVTPPPPKPATAVTPPKPASTTVTLPKPAVVTPPPKPVAVTPSPPKPATALVVVAPVPTPAVLPPPSILSKSPSLSSLLTTPTSALSREDSSRRVQFAVGSPERFSVPRKPPPQHRPSPFSLSSPSSSSHVLGPYSTSHSASFVTSALAFYLLPLVFILLTSPLPDLSGRYAYTHAHGDLVLLAMDRLSVSSDSSAAATTWTPHGQRETGPVAASEARMSAKATRGAQSSIAISVGPAFGAVPAYHAEQAAVMDAAVAFDDAGMGFWCVLHVNGDGDDNAEEVSLMAMDMPTGQRRWNFSEPVEQSMFFGTRANDPITRAGCGVPLVMMHKPDEVVESPAFSVVYHSTRLRTHALKSADGSLVWSAVNDEEQIKPQPGDMRGNRVVGGLVHAAVSDSLCAVLGDGTVFALDRATGQPHATATRAFCEEEEGEEEPSAAEEEEEENALKQERFSRWKTSSKSSSRCSVASAGLVPMQLHAAEEGSAEEGAAVFTRLFAVEEEAEGDDGEDDEQRRVRRLVVVDVLPKADYYDALPFRLVRFNQSSSLEMPGGGGDAPLAVSYTHQLVFVGDANGTVHFVHAGNLSASASVPSGSWAVRGGGEVLSVVFAADENALYASTRTRVDKFDLDAMQPAWSEEDDAEEDIPVRLVNSANLVLTANGVLVGKQAVAATEDEQLLGVSGISLVDRLTGRARSTRLHSQLETISHLSVALDGSVFAVLRPGQRRGQQDEEQHAWVGGVVRFKSLNLLVLARDAACAAWHRAQSALQHEPGWFAGGQERAAAEAAALEDAKHVQLLAWQAHVASSSAGGRSNNKRGGGGLDALAGAVKQQQQQSQVLDGFVMLKELDPLLKPACDALEEKVSASLSSS